MDALLIVIIAVCIGLLANLRRRVRQIEVRLGVSAEITPSATGRAAIGPVQPPAPPVPSIAYQSFEPRLDATPPIDGIGQPPLTAAGGAPWAVRLVLWLREEWLLKLGALLLLIGFGWLVSYAFLNNWIGPFGRITFGIAAGAFILLFGWWRMANYRHQGGIFTVLGSTVILLTVFGAREIYGFFTPASALVVMFLSAALVALASVRYRMMSLALAGLILAGVAPLLTDAPAPDYVGLFAYLLIVTLGTIWIVVFTGWRELTTAALLLVTFYSVPHLLPFTASDRGALLVFAYAFAGAFFLISTLGVLRYQGRAAVPDLVTAAGNGLLLLAWIMTAAPEEWRSLIIAAWLVVFLAGAFTVFQLTRRPEPLAVYAGVGVAMLAAATAAELQGAALTIAYTIESAAIPLIAYWLLRDMRAVKTTCLLLLGPVALSLSSLSAESWRYGVLHQDFFVLLVLVVALAGLGIAFRELRTVLLTGGTLYAYALLWLSLHAVLANDLATPLSLLAYTLVGLAAYVAGRVAGRRGLLLYGGSLLGLVVLRLLLVEVWRMALTGRITIFFLIGALLMSTAFLGRKRIPPTGSANVP